MQIFELNEEVFGSILTNMLKRSPDSYPREEAIVADIIKNVRERGDEAVFEYTKISTRPISALKTSRSHRRRKRKRTPRSIRNSSGS